MTLLPSIFERSQLPLRRSLLADLSELMNEPFAEMPAIASGRFNIDVEELDDKYVIEADLPGVQKKDLDVSLQDRLLTVEVKQSGEREEKDKNLIRQERWRGAASRSITLPHAANNKDVDAKLKDGVLCITVMKEPNGKRKRVAIQ